MGRTTDAGVVTANQGFALPGELRVVWLIGLLECLCEQVRQVGLDLGEALLEAEGRRFAGVLQHGHHHLAEAQAWQASSLADLQPAEILPALEQLLGHPTIASKEWIYRQYDHRVMADTVVEPDAARKRSLAELAAVLGHDFADAALLDRALRHRSWCAENGDVASNERLEFLGDAVLGWAIADLVYRRFESDAEGRLTDLRKAVVSASALAEVAGDIGEIGRCYLADPPGAVLHAKLESR